MGRNVAWDEVPEAGAVVPDGMYQLQIDALTEEQSSTGKLMYTGQYSIVDPVEFAGSMIFERYTIGSEDDPDAGDPLTWKKSVAARLLKTMLVKAQVALDVDMEATCAAAEGNQFLAMLGTETQEGYRPKNIINGYSGVGEGSGGDPGQAAARARPAARPAAPTRPAPAAPRAATPPARPAAPVRPAAPPPRPAPAQPAVPKAQTLTCTICQQKVARAEFADHVEKCDGTAAA